MRFLSYLVITPRAYGFTFFKINPVKRVCIISKVHRENTLSDSLARPSTLLTRLLARSYEAPKPAEQEEARDNA